MEIVIRILVLWILSYPGTFLVWLFQRKNRSFREVRETSSPYMHAVISCCVITIIVLLIKHLVSR